MSKLTRRSFLKNAGVAGAALSAGACCMTAKSYARVIGANDEIRVAVCGVNSQGFANAKKFREIENVKVVAFVDPDQAVLDKKIKEFKDDLDSHIDYREMLARDDIDVVSIATPNHWHSLLAIQSCQAGKDVYVQKPVSHSIWEGTQIEKARVKYNRIVQAGTQNRSDTGLRPLHEYVSAGNLGKLKMARGLCYRTRTGIGKRSTPLTPPETLDYNLWLGPAQDEPIYRNKFHYDWHWSWNTGNGDFGNQGPHETDLLYWFLGNKTLPTSVVTFGGRFGWNDAGETPNMMYTAFEWGDVPVVFEVRDMATKPDTKTSPAYRGQRTGIILDYEGGTFKGGRGGGKIYDKDGKQMKQFPGDAGGTHFKNFIAAVRNRKQSDLHAPVENAHRSATLFHIGNISYRIGKHIGPDELSECMRDEPTAPETLGHLSEQLAAWNIDLKKDPWTVGPKLNFDPGKFRFTGKGPLVKKANSMVKRNYRKPFVVPEKV